MNEPDAGLAHELRALPGSAGTQPELTAVPYVPPAVESEENIQHSLFGEILDWMLAPLLLLWPMSIAITFLIAKSIANQPFDRLLQDSVSVLAQQVHEVDGRATSRLPDLARNILRGDDVDRIYLQIVGPRREMIEGDRDMPAPPDDEDLRRGEIHLRNDVMRGDPVRVAFTYVNLRPHDGSAGNRHAALVQVAESLEKRALLANEIIKGVILPQFIILPIVLALVWFALARGLSPLAELQERIGARPSDDLSPIDARQVPEEISPLVGSLNDMLDRLSQTIEMQKRFIADAAHQMKTPLAGMRMQSELALRQRDPSEIRRSLEQLAMSSESATRLVNQLLALARAENQPHAASAFDELDLAALARDTVQEWVQASFSHRIDLGFEQPDIPIPIRGNVVMLREMLSNLIDNALRYTPAGGSVTVRVGGDDAQPMLEVEDTGPGIAPAERTHVFERFYRILGNTAPGSGLGLAIVREIALQHGAQVDIFNNPRSVGRKWPGCLFRVSFPASAPLPEEDPT